MHETNGNKHKWHPLGLEKQQHKNSQNEKNENNVILFFVFIISFFIFSAAFVLPLVAAT